MKVATTRQTRKPSWRTAWTDGSETERSNSNKKDVHNLFDNIFVHASPEGFCGAFQIIDDQQSTKFMQKSSTTFLKSYLPIYSECVLLDLASFQLINRKHKNNLHELSEQFRELKLTQILPISRYSHLLQLKRIINGALSIMPKKPNNHFFIHLPPFRQNKKHFFTTKKCFLLLLFYFIYLVVLYWCVAIANIKNTIGTQLIVVNVSSMNDWHMIAKKAHKNVSCTFVSSHFLTSNHKKLSKRIIDRAKPINP